MDANHLVYREGRRWQDKYQCCYRGTLRRIGLPYCYREQRSRTHSLGDSFDVKIGSQLKELAPNLWGQEIDLLDADGSILSSGWPSNALFSWHGMDSLVAEETAVLPGMEELSSLMQITSLADSGKYDVIIMFASPPRHCNRSASTWHAGTSRRSLLFHANHSDCSPRHQAHDRCPCPRRRCL